MSTPSPRDLAAAAFLAAHGFGSATLGPKSADASFRHYRRLEGGPFAALLMDAPLEKEPLAPFVAVAEHLRGLGLSTPEVRVLDQAQGFALIEDFGDATFTRLLDAGRAAEPLYAAAVDALVAMQSHPQSAAIQLPPYGQAEMLQTAGLLLEWGWPAMKGSPPPSDVAREYRRLVATMLVTLDDAPKGLVHRDFHVDNLMLLPERAGVARVGILDFQDAGLGYLAYDLASLLQDARRDLPNGLEEAMLARYASQGIESFNHSHYYVLAAQRHLRLLGLFPRLSRRDGKHRYLAHLPRVWRLLERCLEREPLLGPIAAWLDAHFPPDLRTILEPPKPEEASQ